MLLSQTESLLESISDRRLLELNVNFKSGASSLELRPQLEALYPVETCLAILECWSTRQRFTDKFEQIDQWLLAREAAEQATPSVVARWRANFLAQRFPDFTKLTEIGCGIGGDTVFLSQFFEVNAFEADHSRALLARANVKNLGGSARIHLQEIDFTSLEGELLYLDPARRGHKRVFQPEQWTPKLSEILKFAECSKFQAVVIKCAPGLDLSVLPENSEVHFVSVSGELKEAFVVLRRGASSSREAWLLSDSETLRISGDPREIQVGHPEVGNFLHNPDPAIVRAAALFPLAESLQSKIVHPKIAYLCGPQVCQDSRATSFEILDTFPLNWKKLKTKLLKLPWSDYEFLKRGTPFSQQDFRKKLEKTHKSMRKRKGPRGSVIVYRDQTDYRVVLGLRVDDR